MIAGFYLPVCFFFRLFLINKLTRKVLKSSGAILGVCEEAAEPAVSAPPQRPVNTEESGPAEEKNIRGGSLFSLVLPGKSRTTM